MPKEIPTNLIDLTESINEFNESHQRTTGVYQDFGNAMAKQGISLERAIELAGNVGKEQMLRRPEGWAEFVAAGWYFGNHKIA